MEKGSIPKYEILNQIAGYFNVSVGYLFDGESAKFKSSEAILSDIEEKLINDFRNLSPQGQDYIWQQMFMAREVYKKTGFTSSRSECWISNLFYSK